ncbi:gamma-glutamyltransferase [Cupriavidus sp. PET2-C1]
MRSQPGFEAVFLPGGAAPVAGALFLQPTLAQTLERVARTNGKDFYTGETARRFTAFARETGGVLSAEDLRLHAPEWVDAIQALYGALQVSELPPNGQGAVALFAPGVLAHHDVARIPADWAASLHLQIEAIKLAFAEVGPLIGDTDCAIGHVQMMVRLDDYAQSPQAIVDAPRFKVGPGRQLVLEPGFPADTISRLAALGHDVVARTDSTWICAAPFVTECFSTAC